MKGRVTKRRIEAALNTLADLTTEDHDELTGAVRDEFSHVIDVLDRLTEASPAPSYGMCANWPALTCACRSALQSSTEGNGGKANCIRRREAARAKKSAASSAREVDQ